jgi:hypothetical protein
LTTQNSALFDAGWANPFGRHPQTAANDLALSKPLETGRVSVRQAPIGRTPVSVSGNGEVSRRPSLKTDIENFVQNSVYRMLDHFAHLPR